VSHDRIEIIDYHEHALQRGTDAKAVSYVRIISCGKNHWGVGVAEDSVRAVLDALISAINSALTHINEVAA
jgi:2-isopropylmalate synthase